MAENGKNEQRVEHLLDAIGLVKDEYIEEAGGVEGAVGNEGSVSAKRKRSRFVPLAIAACLVVALVGVVGVMNSGLLAGVAHVDSLHEVAASSEAAGESAVESATESAGADRAATESAGTESAMADGLDNGSADEVAGELSVKEMALDGVAADVDVGAAEADGALTPGDVAIPGIARESVEGELDAGEAFVLTAGEWNDNANWPFFTNLVNSGEIAFPSFGIDPRHRVKVTVKDESGEAVRGQAVTLQDEGGKQLWSAQSNRNGEAFLFYGDGESPAAVVAGGVEQSVLVAEQDPEDRQGKPVMKPVDDVEVVVDAESAHYADTQVMFILDTTGSMSDEIAYLQKDFASIASDVGADGVTYSVNFYRDKGDSYVTKCNGFTGDVAAVQAALNDEYADGGGDAPEAVADILRETITENDGWSSASSKVAFLIFDAPPHEGTDAVLDGAVRSAAERGIRMVPVVASNADRETELFGRALSICTDGTYVFLTDDSGVGDSHLQPIVGDYTVEKLHDVIVRIIQESR